MHRAMTDKDHLLNQARLCQRLAENCIDRTTSDRLHELALDYEDQARQADESKAIPTMWPQPACAEDDSNNSSNQD